MHFNPGKDKMRDKRGNSLRGKGIKVSSKRR